jgi:Leucine-rich repeat (LRR) protein
MKNLIKSLILPAIFLTCWNLATAQNTYVPDDNFEQELINLGYDSGALDDYVPTANISVVTSLNLYSLGISDLTGIEDFSSLLDLNFSNNNVSTVDLSALTQLIELELGNNQLTALDISNNTALEQLLCGNNQLTSLNLQHNINLEYLACNNNQISDLHIETSTQ